MARATETIELTASEEAGGFVRVKGTVARDAILSFRGSELGHPGLDANTRYRVRRSMEALTTSEAMESFSAAPLYFGHPGGEANRPTPQTIMNNIGGYPVGNARKLSEGSVGMDYMLVTPQAIEGYRSGKAQMLSSHYSFDPVPAPSGADYDLSAVNIRVEHVAQVPRGRNGPSVRLSEEDLDMDKAEMKEVLEESNKGLLAGLVEGLTKVFKPSASEDDDEPEKPKSKTTITVEEHEAAIKAIDRLNKDRAMVQPLLKSDAAKARVSESDDPVEVFGIALGIKEDEAKDHGADTLRGMAIMALKATASESERNSGSWENINKPDEGGAPKFDEAKAYASMTARADAIRSGQSSVLAGINADQEH